MEKKGKFEDDDNMDIEQPIKSNDKKSRKERIEQIKRKVEGKILGVVQKSDKDELSNIMKKMTIDTDRSTIRMMEENNEKKEKCYVFDFLYSNSLYSVMKMDNYHSFDYQRNTPTPTTSFGLALSYLLQFPVIEFMFYTPNIIPFFWQRTPDKWKTVMSFGEIIYELDRLFETLKI